MRCVRSMVVPVLLLALTAVACDGEGGENGDDGPGGDTTVVTVTASPNLVEDDGRYFTIVEVGFGAEGYVSLSNFTDVRANLSGLYVCASADCFALPDYKVKPGRTVAVAMGDGSGLSFVVATDAGLTLQPADGEIGLYASEDVEEAQDIRAYVQWGSTPHDGTATAIEAGLWIEGSYVETTATSTRIYRSEDTSWVSASD